MKKVCYDCPRKGDCYTESGLILLRPNDIGDCGALFFTTAEASELIDLIIDTIRDVDSSILPDIAKVLIENGYDHENVLERLGVSEDEVEDLED